MKLRTAGGSGEWSWNYRESDQSGFPHDADDSPSGNLPFNTTPTPYEYRDKA